MFAVYEPADGGAGRGHACLLSLAVTAGDVLVRVKAGPSGLGLRFHSEQSVTLLFICVGFCLCCFLNPSHSGCVFLLPRQGPAVEESLAGPQCPVPADPPAAPLSEVLRVRPPCCQERLPGRHTAPLASGRRGGVLLDLPLLPSIC